MDDIKWALDYLWDLAEEHYPNYYSDSGITKVDKIYSKYFDGNGAANRTEPSIN